MVGPVKKTREFLLFKFTNKNFNEYLNESEYMEYPWADIFPLPKTEVESYNFVTQTLNFTGIPVMSTHL